MPKSDINVTPLIDVLLVLLIIFIVVVPRAPRALDASLPKTAGRPLGTDTTSLVLEIRADEFRLNATQVLTLRDLDTRLRNAFETRGDATLFIRAADDIRYARLIGAIDTAKGAGATRIGIGGDDSAQADH
jgi:biopolymer transport protein ExbD